MQAGGNYDIVFVTGATASGKTGFAALLAHKLEAEIISADSRQVYRSMDIGTGKDYDDYIINGKMIPYHLIDIVEPGYKYNVYEYQKDFFKIYDSLLSRKVFPVVCGGSGMYIDSIIRGYRLIHVPLNSKLRDELRAKSFEELSQRLSQYKKLHNTSDTDNHKRAVRAIEIEEYYAANPQADIELPKLNALLIGIKYDRDSRRRRITERLKSRLDGGMVDEVRALLQSGISATDLIYYGLEYKYITLYLLQKLSYKEMFQKLETAIHQFAKRQMTWFRGMERKGIKIHWLDAYMSDIEKLDRVMDIMKTFTTEPTE